MAEIKTIKIHPAIGIARLGNSPTEFFIGPELPGERTPPAGGYKDAQCRIKRQAARFRLFGYDEMGTLVKEITQADASITWTVHLANKKAAWKEFKGLNPNTNLRNAGVADRNSLIVDPGSRSISGSNQAAGLNTGKFLGQVVPLGEIRTDDAGRLLVLGGFGNSASVPSGQPITNYANNDNWHDDVSDGPVTATVTLNGSATSIEASGAWVIAAPPDFAPPIDSIVTLYDVLFQVAVDKLGLTLPAKPSFTQHIYPLLQRTINMKWVSALAGSAHSSLSSVIPPPGNDAARSAIFYRLRNPAGGGGNMPDLYGDTYIAPPKQRLSVTPSQYKFMQQWAAGDFINDWTGPPAPATEITPEGLDRAALEACAGGAFYPGIEAGWFLRDVYTYLEPFRLNPTGLAAGDVTKQMAVPWQADFNECELDGGVPWWPAQRPDDVFPAGSGTQVLWKRDLVNTDEDMVARWHQLGFVVKQGDQYVETERHVVCKDCFVVTDRSTFSKDEVDALLTAGSPARFENAFYVIVEGFLPSELGINTPTPTPAQLAAIAPTITLKRPDNSPVPGISATPQTLLLEDSSLPSNLRQRFTFAYAIEFTNTDAFIGIESLKVLLTATIAGLFCPGNLTLIQQPNPYMIDGSTSWLSTDVRVFQIKEGEAKFGLTMGNDAAGAIDFIQKLLSQFNLASPINHPFNTISTDQQTSTLELSRSVNGKRVFNFAVAQVRYRGKILAANDVRVFFRLFTTAATGLEYRTGSTYRRTIKEPKIISLIGIQGGQIVTIPFFAEARIDTTSQSMTEQLDSTNIKTLNPAGAQEVYAYFGCWLDFNQTEPRFPIQPSPADGPYPAGSLKSIQELIRGMHQCLVAEVYFASDPIPEGATPAASENLAQRNLAISESDNPGSLATHTVQHTFEFKPTQRQARIGFLPEQEMAVSISVPNTRISPDRPDEIMILWKNLPRSTQMTLYMPDVDANNIIRTAGLTYEAQRLERVDDRTIRCLPGDITYLPLPANREQNIAGLMTLELPEGVRHGQVFTVIVQQVSSFSQSIIGAFQITIPVRSARELLPGEIRKLSVLRHINRAIPTEDRWYPVFLRYIDQVAARVRGFGGDPDTVAPSPDGTGRDEQADACARRSWLMASLLAVFLLTLGFPPSPITNGLAIIVAFALLAAGWDWYSICQPRFCQFLKVYLRGAGIGGGLLGLLLLIGFGGSNTPLWLGAIAISLGIGVVFGIQKRCL